MNEELVGIEDLSRRLRVAEDQLALLAIEGVYGYLYDSRQGEAWAELFTDDGVYEGRRWATVPASRQSFTQGRGALADLCEHDSLSGAHFMNLPHFIIDGDSATARIHFQIHTQGKDEFDRYHAWAVNGYYDAAYLRTDVGWKIKRRITTYLEAVQRTLYGYEPSAAGLATVAEPRSKGVASVDGH